MRAAVIKWIAAGPSSEREAGGQIVAAVAPYADDENPVVRRAVEEATGTPAAPGAAPVEPTTAGAGPAEGAADYSFVPAPDGEVVGIWLRDEAQARDQDLLIALLIKHGIPPTVTAGGLRVVPNTDDRGGCFVMFGGAPAPGEGDRA